MSREANKILKKLVFAGIFTLALAGYQKEAKAGLAKRYFPLNVGNSWTYTNYFVEPNDPNEPPPPGGPPIPPIVEFTFTIIGTEEIDGHTYYKFNDYFNIYPPPPNGEHRVTIGRETLFRYDLAADKVLMRWAGEVVVRYDFTGEEWDPGGAFGWSRLKQVGVACNVPAGEFSDCINFQFDWWSGGGPDAYAHGEYLAPNVGNIKFVRPGGDCISISEGERVTFELLSYTIVPEPAMIYYVDADATGANDGSSWADAYNYLQDALTAAWNGDEIWVAQGIYKPDQGGGNMPSDRTATFQLINGVTIKGSYAGFGEPDSNARDIDAYEAVLSGDLAGNDVEVADPRDLLEHPSRDENSYHVVTGSGTDETAVLDGFTITCGSAEYRSRLERFNADNAILIPPPIYGPENWGGGLYNSRGSPTVSSCTFTKNTAYSGGAIYNRYNSSPMLTQCTFSENIAKYGGGMYNSQDNSILTNCTFNGNVATGSGGGIFSFGPILTLTDCLLTENAAGWSGGAICNGYGNLKMTNCTLRGNCANYNGGGMLSDHSSVTLTNCTFSGNCSADAGGGMYNYRSDLTLTNCIFSGNSGEGNGGGIYCRNNSLTRVINCTFAVNSALNGTSLACDSYGSEYPSSVQVTNSIFWDGGNEIWNNDGSTIMITYSDIQGGWPSEGNIDIDPSFVAPGYWDANGVWLEGDYHLLPSSPCIDAGDPNYVPEPNETDLDGRPRIVGGRIDMGAYEYSPPVPAEVRIVPSTINLASKGKWITCYIWRGEDYDVADIDPNSVRLEDEIQARSLLVDEQEQVAIVRFSRSEVQGILDVGDVELTITGQLTDGTRFEGTDTIRVIDKGGKK